MDVTRHNFIDILPQLSPIVSECDFVAIDTELSGLRKEWKSLSLIDLPDQRYRKLNQSIFGYHLIEFGLTCFKRNASNGYDCNCYNFYIFPQNSALMPHHNRTFSVQSSSLTFLVNNGFDFNKLIRDGISYLNREEENVCVQTLKAQNDNKSGDNYISSAQTDEDKKFVNEILDKVNAFLSDNDLNTLDLMPFNAFRRKLIYEALRTQTYVDYIDIKTVAVSQNSNDRYLSIIKINKKEKENKQLSMLTEAIGFSKVIQLLIEKQKPIVGHNVLLDLMHIFNQFIELLPQNYNDFKQSIHSLFPILYDTKHISSSQPFKDLLETTALGDIYERLKKEPFKTIDVKLINGINNEKSLHEAGYDSYVTGVCFLNLNNYLCSLTEPSMSGYNPILLNQFKNKLYLTYSLDTHYLNFDDEDIIADRSHVFHITFPKEWKANELHHLFSAFGGVSIIWVNETSAFCALKESNNSVKIRKSLFKHTSNSYKVVSYNDFISQNKNSNELNSRDTIKRTSNITKSQTLNPIKKTKLIIDNESIKSRIEETNVEQSNEKLFEETQQWDSK